MFWLYFLPWIFLGIVTLVVDGIWSRISWLYTIGVISFPHENTLGLLFLAIAILLWPIIAISWLLGWARKFF